MDDRKFDSLTGVSDMFRDDVARLHAAFLRRTTISILIVVDGFVSLTEAPSGFGIGRIVRLLREEHIGCTHFRVDLARREGEPGTNSNPLPNQPRYTGFRFNLTEDGAPVLNNYHEVWCFGFNPDNAAETDANIVKPEALPLSDPELEALTDWMNNERGGVLAMGDHDYLGASMCHKIPRVRSMRRWTNAQGVPPIGDPLSPDTADRHDTNQPATPEQLGMGALIPFFNQEDSTPQRIEWVPWLSQRLSIIATASRPHPILCHPTLGPIDVMPDHPHEGWCFEDDEVDLTKTFDLPSLSVSVPEYPLANGKPHGPRVVAHGWTTPNPPYNLAKGPSPRKHFAMISAYDGHRAGVGRVVTDSTWHHWFDENIQAIEAAGGDNWEKISRYYLNVAKWLAPPTVIDWCITLEVLTTHFTYLGFEEYREKASVFDLGLSLHAQLRRRRGPCWVSQFVLDKIHLIDNDLWAWLAERLFWRNGIPIPKDPCLSCPPFELVEIAVLGGLVKATMPVAQEIRARALGTTMKKAPPIEPEELVKQALDGVQIGTREFRTALAHSVRDLQALMR